MGDLGCPESLKESFWKPLAPPRIRKVDFGDPRVSIVYAKDPPETFWKPLVNIVYPKDPPETHWKRSGSAVSGHGPPKTLGIMGVEPANQKP